MPHTASYFAHGFVARTTRHGDDQTFLGPITRGDLPTGFRLELRELRDCWVAALLSGTGARTANIRSFQGRDASDAAAKVLEAVSALITFPILSKDPTPPAPAPTVIQVECTHLVSLPGPDGTQHHVLFDPALETVQAIYAWARVGDPRVITVDDRAGRHTSTHEFIPGRVTHSYGTLCLESRVK